MIKTCRECGRLFKCNKERVNDSYCNTPITPNIECWCPICNWSPTASKEEWLEDPCWEGIEDPFDVSLWKQEIK